MMTKKLFSALVSIVLVVSTLSAITLAADENTVELYVTASGTPSVGSKIAVTVFVGEVELLAAGDLALSYDADVLSFSQVVRQHPLLEYGGVLNPAQDGTVYASFAKADGQTISGKEVLYEIEFEAKAAGSAAFSIGVKSGGAFQQLDSSGNILDLKAHGNCEALVIEGGQLPQLEGTVTITPASATVGTTLTADVTGITILNPGTFSYQWNRNGAAIDGAVQVNYVVQKADIGAHLTVTVQTSECQGSLTSGGITPSGLPQITGSVQITGKENLDETLTAQTEQLPDDAGNLSYQWYRGSQPISGADSSTYTVVVADVFTEVSVHVAAENYAGELISPAVKPENAANIQIVDVTEAQSKALDEALEKQAAFQGIAANRIWKQDISYLNDAGTPVQPGAGGVTIVVPYSKGASQDDSFAILHLVNGVTPQTITDFRKAANGLIFTISEFSPFAFGYQVHTPSNPSPPSHTGGSGSGGSGGGSGASPNAPAQGTLFFRPGEYDFWQTVIQKINSSESGTAIAVDAKWFDRMPVSVLKALKNKNLTLQVRWNGGKDFVVSGTGTLPAVENRVNIPLSTLCESADSALEKATMGTAAPVLADMVPVPQDSIATDAQAGVAVASHKLPETGPSNMLTAPMSARILPAAVTVAGNEAGPFKTVPDEEREASQPGLLPKGGAGEKEEADEEEKP